VDRAGTAASDESRVGERGAAAVDRLSAEVERSGDVGRAADHQSTAVSNYLDAAPGVTDSDVSDRLRPLPADLAEERPHGLGELGGVLVIRVVSIRRDGDVDAQAFAEAAGDLGEEGKAVLADEQTHRRGKRGQRLVVGQVELVAPELDRE
jgi:hypothetical protein